MYRFMLSLRYCWAVLELTPRQFLQLSFQYVQDGFLTLGDYLLHSIAYAFVFHLHRRIQACPQGGDGGLEVSHQRTMPVFPQLCPELLAEVGREFLRISAFGAAGALAGPT